MLDRGKRNSLSKGTFPAHNPFEQPWGDVAAWVATPVLPWGMLLCSGPPNPCLRLPFCKKSEIRLCILQDYWLSGKGWVEAGSLLPSTMLLAGSRGWLQCCQHMVIPCSAEPALSATLRQPLGISESGSLYCKL